MAKEQDQPTSTQDAAYAARLATLEGARWKQLLNVQLPYQLNLRRLRPGRTLDVGCGIGRNLRTLGQGSVGVDHNQQAVLRARERGLDAYVSRDFQALPVERRTGFDTLLFAHVFEHMSEVDATSLLREYLPSLDAGGKVIIITPQEKGYRTDPTHVRFVDLAGSARLVTSVGLQVQEGRSFPFPRAAGRVFSYNEFVLVARRSA